MSTATPTLARPLGLPRLDPSPARSVPATYPDPAPTLPALRSLASAVAASIGSLRDGDPEAGRRARVLVDAIGPLVRLPDAGPATVQDVATVTFREVQVALRSLARLTAVDGSAITRAFAGIEHGMASA